MYVYTVSPTAVSARQRVAYGSFDLSTTSKMPDPVGQAALHHADKDNEWHEIGSK